MEQGEPDLSFLNDDEIRMGSPNHRKNGGMSLKKQTREKVLQIGKYGTLRSDAK